MLLHTVFHSADLLLVYSTVTTTAPYFISSFNDVKNQHAKAGHFHRQVLLLFRAQTRWRYSPHDARVLIAASHIPRLYTYLLLRVKLVQTDVCNGVVMRFIKPSNSITIPMHDEIVALTFSRSDCMEAFQSRTTALWIFARYKIAMVTCSMVYRCSA